MVLALTTALVVSATGAPTGSAPPNGFVPLKGRFPAPQTPFVDESMEMLGIRPRQAPLRLPCQDTMACRENPMLD